MMEDKSEKVSEETKQSGEMHARWAWVEPRVWTERMLTTLETGVRGGKWHSLIDKVWALVLPGALPVFSMLVVMNYMRSLPKELEEARFRCLHVRAPRGRVVLADARVSP